MTVDAVDLAAVFAALPGVELVLAPDAPRYTMLAVTAGRLAATMTTREGTLGRPLFAVFPDANPANDAPSGVRNLRASLDTVLRTRLPHRMPVQRYDLQRPDDTWEARYWAPLNVPVLGPDGTVGYLIHRVEDVTDAVQLLVDGDRLRGAAAASERARADAETGWAESAAALALLRGQARELARANAQFQAQAAELAATTGALRATAARLEAQVAVAEAARGEAERANHAKGEFLAVMSHELRTPLNAIGGYAQLMELGLHGPVTPEQLAALGRIQRGQQHLLGLINAVLNYAKLEAGRVAYDAADVPAAELLAEIAALVAPQARAMGLVLAVAPCVPAPGATGDAAASVARADPDKVRQVLLNLLSNAVKFTPRGGTVTLACGPAPAARVPGDGAPGGDPGGRRVTFAVADTGRGIPADQLARVFEPFVQVDQRLTRTEEGAGLGLAISRDLARGMGGDLTAESAVGAGSTFTLTLPAA
ncbi:hypothetical protein tb265_24970 [Gemmatimonadetes bacterium T265]|nr:hypothetical protein tb265_24970 [Gemmatimonadetes bacterium T265]